MQSSGATLEPGIMIWLMSKSLQLIPTIIEISYLEMFLKIKGYLSSNQQSLVLIRAANINLQFLQFYC